MRLVLILESGLLEKLQSSASPIKRNFLGLQQ